MLNSLIYASRTKKTKNTLWLVAAILCTVFFTACWSGGGSPTPEEQAYLESQLKDVAFCKLISPVTLEQIFDADYTSSPANQTAGPNTFGCIYTEVKGATPVDSDTSTDPSAEPEWTRTFNAFAQKTESSIEAKKQFNSAAAVWKNTTIGKRSNKEVQGIGDAAFWSYSSKIPQLITYENDTLLIITFSFFEEEEQKLLSNAKLVAEEFFEKLPELK